jgi:hypothetical protein
MANKIYAETRIDSGEMQNLKDKTLERIIKTFRKEGLTEMGRETEEFLGCAKMVVRFSDKKSHTASFEWHYNSGAVSVDVESENGGLTRIKEHLENMGYRAYDGN